MTGTERLSVEPAADAAEWDRFVETVSGGTFCHLAGWQSVLGGVMGHATHYLTARAPDGSLEGVLPVVRLSSPLFGRRYVSVPYLNDGGPLGTTAGVERLVAEAELMAERDRATLQLRMRTGPVEAEASKVTVLLDLPDNPEELWKRLPSKLRSQVRRPQKAGMTTRFGADQLDAFYDVWSRNMLDLGTPVLGRSFFQEIVRTFPSYFEIGCVYQGDVPVAAGAGFFFGTEFEITWASSLRSHSASAPNMLLYWEFMSRAIERDARTFNFGRCTPGEGTHRFKLQWGGETVPLPWVNVPRADSAKSRGPGRSARLVSAAWQRLPLRVANLIGPVIARQLPWW
ncbi:MAG TPA: FemAB family XrtA/PEP-CTERM system-associated protein [Longimicrobiales bacterium]